MFPKQPDGTERVVQEKEPGRELEGPVFGFGRREVFAREEAQPLAGTFQKPEAVGSGFERWSRWNGAGQQAVPNNVGQRFFGSRIDWHLGTRRGPQQIHGEPYPKRDNCRSAQARRA